MDDDDEPIEIIYCTYDHCADTAVPCPRCTVIVVGGKYDGLRTTVAEMEKADGRL